MPNTGNGLPFPASTGVPPNVPLHIQQLAEAVDPWVGDTDWIILPLEAGFTGQGGSSPTYRRRAGWVILRWGIAATGTVNGSQTIATLPVGFRPNQNVYMPGVSGPNDQAEVGSWVITTTGAVQLRRSVAAADYYLFPGHAAFLAEG